MYFCLIKNLKPHWTFVQKIDDPWSTPLTKEFFKSSLVKPQLKRNDDGDPLVIWFFKE